MYSPANYQQINLAYGTCLPSTRLQRMNNVTFDYWCRCLFQRACFVMDFDLDEKFKGNTKDFFLWCLFTNGYVAFFEDDRFGLTFQPCTLSGMGWYYQFTDAIISNPQLNKTFKIGEDCEILKLSPDYMGIWDIICYYADKLAQLSLSIDMSIINTRFAKILCARNKAAGAALRKAVDKINQGEPVVIHDVNLLNDKTDKESPFQDFSIDHLTNNYITDKQLADLQTVLNAFDNEIGIPSLPYAEKKERMIMDEANAKRIESTARCTIWKNCMNECFDVINAHFGTSMHVEIRDELRPRIADIEEAEFNVIS